MTNLERYNKSFEIALEVNIDNVNNLEYGLIQNWDSLGHMSLISEIENAFGIEFNSEDITELISYKKGKDLLKKYNVFVE